MIWAVAAVSVAVIAALTVTLLSLDRLRFADGVPVVEVVRQDFVRRVYAEGHLKAVEATPVSTPVDVPGPFKIAWLAPDGSRVREGEVVVRFDATDIRRNLADGEADRETAGYKTAQRTIERAATLENLTRDAELARKELRYAKEFQSKDPELFSKTDILESEIDEKLASHREASATGAREIQEDLAGAELDLLEIERRKAELRIEEAEAGLQALEITAPHDGILVYERDWSGQIPQVGQTFWNGNTLAEIPNLDTMEAEVYVLEADAGGLIEDRSADVTLESRPDVVFRARIKQVDALAKRKVRWVPVQYFGVTLELERTDTDMKPGQRVNALILLDELDDVLVVPRDAVFDDDDGNKFVYLRQAGGFAPVDVELGTSALGRVVIESGVDEGDFIAMHDPSRTIDASSDESSSAVEMSTGGGRR
jgi:multidrug efflux pump subunit AcrA (membrane-fusion protein)